MTKTKHGKWGHPLYHIWNAMMQRCHNPNCDNYKRYGEKGIIVCNSWHNVVNFINDMYPTFKRGLTIERIDNNGNYEPGNCKWATHSEQSLNRLNLNIGKHIRSHIGNKNPNYKDGKYVKPKFEYKGKDLFS
jgi:hypothetical protein